MTAKKQAIEAPEADAEIQMEPIAEPPTAVVIPQFAAAIAHYRVIANGKMYKPGESIPNLSHADYQYLLARKAVTKG